MLRALRSREHVMLKITAIDGDRKRTLVLEGSLMDRWVGELERTWIEAQRTQGELAIVVDLKDVIAISQQGEDLLFQMMSAGATFHCCRGVLTKHVLQQLERRRETNSRKGQDSR
jgi:hypothetical protein